MKKISTIAILALTIGQALAQGPTLSLVGGSPSLAKGVINTEVLTEIIQQKQEEVKKMVFRNTIVKGFNNSNYTDALKNFTTYHYMYNLMDIMTSGKNKTVITKSITESTSEFAYVFGLALYIQRDLATTTKTKTLGTLTLSDNFIETAKVNYISDGTLKITSGVKDFNIIMDLCYDIILNDASLQKAFKFKDDLSDDDFKTWYDSDNAYLIDYTKAEGVRKTELDNLRIELKARLNDLTKLVKVRDDIMTSLNDLKSSPDKKLNEKANELLSSLSDLSGEDIASKLNELQTSFSGVLTADQNTALTKVASLIDNNYDNFKELAAFYSGLKKSKYKDFTLTKEQYYSMKYVMIQFLDLAKNQYDNNAVATVIDFMLENTLVEYSDNSGTQKLEDDVTNNDKGYLYIDIESLISSIDQKFSPNNKKGRGVYVSPFLSLGTNYASFLGTNTLATVGSGDTKSLANLYFASEKIGIKWKIWNWKYTRSFGTGENFKYYNCSGKSRYWLRPQPKPMINDIHLFAYGSGLLYNIANLKSTENFNYAIAGGGLGMTFFNGLTANVSLACPITGNEFYSDNIFFNFGFDIPIVEYIAALKKK